MPQVETCTRCSSEDVLRETGSYGIRVLTCNECGYTESIGNPPLKAIRKRRTASAPAGQMRLFGPYKSHPIKEDIPEETVQANSITQLCREGFRVLQTTVRYKWQHCEHCGRKHRPEGGYGATPGVTDLLVCENWWPVPVMLAMEIKGTKTKVSDAQEDLERDARIVIVRHWDDAVLIAKQVRESMRRLKALLEYSSLPTGSPEDRERAISDIMYAVDV